MSETVMVAEATTGTNTVMENFKADYSMLYVNKKLTFGALVRCTVKEASGDEEVSAGGFFSKPVATTADDIEEGTKVITTFVYVKPDGKTMLWLDADSKGAEFLVQGKSAPTFDMYSDDIAKAIKKDVGKYKGFLNKQPEGVIKDINALSHDEQQAVVQSDLFKDMEEVAVKQYGLMMKGIDAEKKKHAGIGMDDFLERYAFKKHILLTGKAGVSKTYTSTKWIEESGYESEFIAGHSGLESIDLLGYWVKASDGNLVWLDGALTAAFRKAQTHKTVLLFDELLRVPARELSILVGALTPDSSGNYRLRTSRLTDVKDGVGETETIVIPAENLHVIATTNIGADYDVENIDVALQDRFRTHDVTMSVSTIYSICETVADDKFGDTTISAIVDLYEQINNLVDSNELARPMSIRHLTEVINYSDTPADIASFFRDLDTIICSRNTNGTINPTERKIFLTAIKKTIK